MPRLFHSTHPTRRQMIQTAAAAAASTFLPGCSSSTAPAGTATPQSQTITFSSASPIPYSATPITLTASASSGLPVTFTLISGPATLSGAILTLKGPGTVVVSASQPGNSSYAAAPTVSLTIAVTNTNPQPVPTSPTAATVLISTTAAGSIGSAFTGLSYEKYNLWDPTFSASNTNLIALFKLLGPSVLRIGGATTDEYVWKATGAGQTSGQVAPSDLIALAAFLKATGWTCLYAINLGGSGPGGTAFPTTPALAAAEVASVVSILGSSLLGIEIGNEPDSYDTTYYAGTTWNVGVFETLWEQYRTAILATTPTAPITGPAVAVFSRLNSWTIPFAQYATKSQITQLTQHYYRASGTLPTSTAANLITADTTLVSGLQTLLSGAQAQSIPYRIAECNNYSNGGVTGVSNAYASTLWALDFLFNCAQGGASGVNFHGGGAATGYTPIADSSGTVVQIRPEYYGLLFFTLAGQGTLYQTTVSAGSLNVTAYAVKTPTGGLNVVLSNKDSSQNLQVTVQLPQSISTARILELTQLSSGSSGPSLAATSGVTIQGATVGLNASFAPADPYLISPSGTQLTCYVPYLSAVLLELA